MHGETVKFIRGYKFNLQSQHGSELKNPSLAGNAALLSPACNLYFTDSDIHSPPKELTVLQDVAKHKH